MDIHTCIEIKNPLFYLLQISDPLFPIGGYTQSYGLETYVRKGIVHDAESSERYLGSYLWNNFLYNDLLAVKLAWQYASENELKAICRLDSLLSAAKSPRELRTASIKLGTRFSKIVETILTGKELFDSFLTSVKSGKSEGHYCVMYGLAAELLGIDRPDVLAAVSYSTASSIINNCAKLVPISQKDGQDILFKFQEDFQRLVARVETLEEDSIGISCFGFDLRSMQHERLYTRLYIS
jgi:urease accessory protein